MPKNLSLHDDVACNELRYWGLEIITHLSAKTITPLFYSLAIHSVFNLHYISITIEHYILVLILLTHK